MRTRWLLLLFCLMLAVPFVSSTTVVPLSVERLTQISTHVVEGRATESWSQWNPAHTVISTYTKFQVLRTLKGQAPEVVVVRQLGGRVEGINQRVAGVRAWRTGEQAVLFLRPDSLPNGGYVVTGLMQGNFLVRRDAKGEIQVSNSMSGVSSYQAATGQISDYKGREMRLQDLESRVQKAVRP
jgi:hypothetical protein